MSNNLKLKIYTFFLVILIIIAVIVGTLIVVKFEKNKENENEARIIVNEILNKQMNNEEQLDYQFKGYNIIGILQIPKIDIEYPIIEECNKETMKVSVGRYWGGKVNENGNLSIAAHNNKDGTMFGKTKYLKLGDEIYLTDMKKNKIKYIVNDIFTVEPNNVEILETKNKDVKEVTLITCTNGNKNRLIVKAIEETL